MQLSQEQLMELHAQAVVAELCLQVEHCATRNPLKRYRIRRAIAALQHRIKFLERMAYQPAGHH